MVRDGWITGAGVRVRGGRRFVKNEAAREDEHVFRGPGARYGLCRVD